MDQNKCKGRVERISDEMKVYMQYIKICCMFMEQYLGKNLQVPLEERSENDFNFYLKLKKRKLKPKERKERE